MKKEVDFHSIAYLFMQAKQQCNMAHLISSVVYAEKEL
jgi:hypothetical protein